jgi:hypothetical protein
MPRSVRFRSLARWSDDRLLDLRLCDLGASWERSWLRPLVRQVQRELAERDLRVRPHFWVSDEWFSPDGVPGVAIPFYLTHPRLMRLERRFMLEVEGGSPAQCLRILRHEAGHAVHHAFELQRSRRWQRVFGPSSRRYPDVYRPNPASRRFVIHLPNWYAQAHPAEDFAETFALWLAPHSGWRKRYAGWPALRKLVYVDALMAELAGRRPPVRRRARIDPIERNRTTLREHYEQKRQRFSLLATHIYDDDLLRIFGDPGGARGVTAAAFLRRHRVRLRRLVSNGTGKHPLAVDAVLGQMIARARELQLRTRGSPSRLQVEFAILLAARSVEYLYRRQEHAL